MDLLQHIINLERRIAALEANRGASLRFGTVTEASPNGSARVQLHDGGGMVSQPLRTLHRRTLKDKDQCLPDVGEQVAVLFSGQGLEQGCVLGAVYSQKDAAPGQEQPMQFYRFEDGTVISYDRANHKFFADIKGEADITVKEDARVTLLKNGYVAVQGEAKVQVTQNATVSSGQMLVLEGAAGVRMRGPSIRFEGLEKGVRCKAAIDADLFLKGAFEHEGNLTQTGNQNISGNQQLGGNLNAGGDISASGAITGNPVYGCRH